MSGIRRLRKGSLHGKKQPRCCFDRKAKVAKIRIPTSAYLHIY